MKYFFGFLLFISTNAFADTNLLTCLSGKYPSLCDITKLSAEQLEKTNKAVLRENLATCLLGKYPALCKHNMLVGNEVDKVRESERKENLKTCLIGKYSALCNHNLLVGDELTKVEEAERKENLKTCLSGKYPALCKHNLLTGREIDLVVKSEEREARSKPVIKNKQRISNKNYSVGAGCDGGHWVDSVSSNGEIVKLEDGSIWKVGGVDAIDSMLWLPTTDIIVCDDKLINTDDNEAVDATRLK